MDYVVRANLQYLRMMVPAVLENLGIAGRMGQNLKELTKYASENKSSYYKQ